MHQPKRGREGRPPTNKGTGKSPYLNNSPSLDELPESYAVVADLFFGCQLNTWLLLPTLCNGRERFAPKDAEEEEEEDEEEEEEDEEPEDLILFGCGAGAVLARGGPSATSPPIS